MNQAANDPGEARSGGLAAIGLVYVALFLGRGVASPLMPLWLDSRGLSGEALAMVLAAPNLARLLTGPAIALAANRLALQRSGLIWLGGAIGLGFAVLGVSRSPGVLGGAWFLAATASAACLPLLDAMALTAVRASAWTYGRMRALGSAAYAVASLAGGFALKLFGPTALLVWSLAAAAMLALGARTLPPFRVAERVSPKDGPIEMLRRLWEAPGFGRVTIVLALVQGSHALFYGFSSLLWRDRGFDGVQIGALWGASVVAEIMFLVVAERVREALSDWGLLRIGAAVGVARWIAMALSPSFEAQLVLQGLHALSYSATFVAALHLIGANAAARDSRVAQSMCAGVAGGFGVGVVMLCCGSLYNRMGAGAYCVMAGLSGLAILAIGRRRANPS